MGRDEIMGHIYDWLVREQGLSAQEADDVLAGRAALRSDSPESEDNPDDRIARVDEQVAVEANLRSKGDWIDTDLGLEFIRRPASTGGEAVCTCARESGDTWDCPRHPSKQMAASTGGERDEPSDEWAQHLQDAYDRGKADARKELEQTPGYIHGYNTGFDEAMEQESGAVPVEVDSSGVAWSVENAEPGVYVAPRGEWWLIPRVQDRSTQPPPPG